MERIPIDSMYHKYMEYQEVYKPKMSARPLLSAFVHWCHKNYPGEEFLTQEMLDNWCSVRPTEEWNTCAQRVSRINTFVRFCEERGYGPYSIRKMKKTKEWPFYKELQQEEIIRFFESVDEYSNELFLKSGASVKSDKLNGIRSIGMLLKAIQIPVIYRLDYSTGMRPNETRLLMRRSVNLDRGYIHLTVAEVKGYVERIVPINESLMPWLDKYDEIMEKIVPDRKAFFSRQDGQPHSAWWYRTVFRVCWDRRNKSKAVAYAFRHHYVIENIVETNGNMINTKKLIALSNTLGHTKLKRTKYYSHMTPRLGMVTQKARNSFFNEINEDEYEKG